MTYQTMGLIKNVSSTGETARDVSAGELLRLLYL